MDKRVYVTGGGGWLAGELLLQLAAAGFEAVGVSRSPSKTGCISNNEFLSHVDVSDCFVVHCAFCRKGDGEGLVQSLELSRSVFEKCAREGAAGVINISSQSVYGIEGGMSSVEGTPLRPHDLYPMAKAACETLCNSAAASVPHTSLRLASVMGVSGGRTPNCVLRKFVNAALDGEDLNVLGGRQNFSFLDIRDAAAAVPALLAVAPASWSGAYNVTPDGQTNIVDLANLVANVAARVAGKPSVSVRVSPEGAEISSGGCNKLFCDATGWRPSVPIEGTVEAVVGFKLKERNNSK